MTSKKKTTKAKAKKTKPAVPPKSPPMGGVGTKASPRPVLSVDQKLAIVEEAIERLPAGNYYQRMREFAAWWSAFGLPEVMQFHEETTDKAVTWKLLWNSGQFKGETMLDHAAIPEDERKPPRFGSRIVNGRRYDCLVRPNELSQAATQDALECLRAWRRMLLAGQKTDPKKKPPQDSSSPIPPEAWCAWRYQMQMKKDGRKCTKDQALDYAIGKNCRKGREYLKKQMRRCETTKPPRKRRTGIGH